MERRLRGDQHVYMLLGKANKNGEEQWQESPRRWGARGRAGDPVGAQVFPRERVPQSQEETGAQVGTGGTGERVLRAFQMPR